jgi:hypothetical protein
MDMNGLTETIKSIIDGTASIEFCTIRLIFMGHFSVVLTVMNTSVVSEEDTNC